MRLRNAGSTARGDDRRAGMTDAVLAGPVRGNHAFIAGPGIAQTCSWGSPLGSLG